MFKGSQKIVSHLKGEATDAITSVIELFVGGIQYTSGKIWQASETFHNAFFDFVESIYNGILEFISPAIWAVMKAFQRFEMGALGLKQKFFEVMIAIRDIFFTIMEEFANSSIFGFIYGDDAVKAVRQQIAYFRAESDFIDAIRSYSEKAGLSVNAALKEIIAPVIGFSRRSSNMPRNNLASFCGDYK